MFLLQIALYFCVYQSKYSQQFSRSLGITEVQGIQILNTPRNAPVPCLGSSTGRYSMLRGLSVWPLPTTD